MTEADGKPPSDQYPPETAANVVPLPLMPDRRFFATLEAGGWPGGAASVVEQFVVLRDSQH
ncbi:MAG TPA: hypothetical protein VGF39_18500 [Stellaceae bacterium]|jgi:hypothetical protein